MAGEFKVYDLDAVSFILGGIPISGGAGEGGFLEIEPLAPDFDTTVGVDGSVSRSKTGNMAHRVKVICLQTSGINAILNGLLVVDRTAGNGAGVVPIAIADLQGLSLLVGPTAWVEGKPKQAYGRKAGDHEWSIMVVNPLVDFAGGN